MSNDDQIAYLAGDDGASLTPAERAEMDDLRAALAHPAVWIEPDAELEERVVAAIADDGPRGRSRTIRYALVGGVAAVLLAVGLTIGVTTRHQDPPLQYAASLSGTQLAPDATGEVTLTKTAGGWKIQLDATNLPRRDNGAYYEAWLKNDAGVLVPIGTFNQGTNVTLWAGVSPKSFRTLTVTRELANGDQASSGEKVLVGTAEPRG